MSDEKGLSKSLQRFKDLTERHEKKLLELSEAIKLRDESPEGQKNYEQALKEQQEFWDIVSEFSDEGWGEGAQAGDTQVGEIHTDNKDFLEGKPKDSN